MQTKVGIVGAGTMGKQIALLFASKGFSVTIWNHRLQSDFSKVFKRLAVLQSKLGYLNKDSISAIEESVYYTDDISLLADRDLIIECVTEDEKTKKKILRLLGPLVSEQCVIATNTSTLSVTELASSIQVPGNFVGVHFFNPPLTMKLVEVVKGEFTSEETLSLVDQILVALGKHSVVLPETPGFVVNRLLFPMINEAVFLLAEGVADAKTIDNCMRLGANHPMGPLELADLIGLDTCLSILKTLVDETGDGKYRPAPLLKKYVRAGKLGKKVGIGFYSYRKKG